MTGKIVICLLLTFFLLTVSLAQAQQVERIYRIGYLRVDRPPDNYLEAFQQHLRDHGYVEKKSIVVEYRTS